MVGGGLGPVAGRLFGSRAGPKGVGDILTEQVGVRREAVNGQFGRVLAERRGWSDAGGSDTGDHGELQNVSFERGVEALVVSRLTDCLVVAERADDRDSGVGGFGPGEQVEPTRDEDIGDEDIQVGCVAVAVDPGVVVGQLPGEREPLVDELDASGSVSDAVSQINRWVAGCARADERQDAGRQRRVVKASVDPLVKPVRLDIVDCRQRRSANCRHFLHYEGLATGRAKTFGNRRVTGSMVQTTSGDGIRTLTLDRPDQRNALTSTALRDLEAAVESATEPVLYLHGAGEAFCAGADLDEVKALDSESAETFATLGQRVARTLESYDGAVVAGIDGAARGGGVELALACDIRAATPDATLAETGVKLGLFGAWGGTARLPDIVGTGEALDIALSGRTLDAETAQQMGLVSRVTTEPRAVAEELAGVDADALRVLKARIRDDSDRETQERREQQAFADLNAETE